MLISNLPEGVFSYKLQVDSKFTSLNYNVQLLKLCSFKVNKVKSKTS